jgi:hypothetical protein
LVSPAREYRVLTHPALSRQLRFEKHYAAAVKAFDDWDGFLYRENNPAVAVNVPLDPYMRVTQPTASEPSSRVTPNTLKNWRSHHRITQCGQSQPVCSDPPSFCASSRRLGKSHREGFGCHFRSARQRQRVGRRATRRPAVIPALLGFSPRPQGRHDDSRSSNDYCPHILIGIFG